MFKMTYKSFWGNFGSFASVFVHLDRKIGDFGYQLLLPAPGAGENFKSSEAFMKEFIWD